MRGLALALLGFAIAPVTSAADAKPPITHEALWLFKSVGAPAPSPDGKWVVVPVTEPAYDEKDEVADLWIVSADGSGTPRRLTSARGSERDAAFSPDGRRIAFSAKREGDDASQIYVLDLAGGEATRLTSVALGARSPKWSPDGRKILFQGPAYPGATNDAANKTIADERKNAKSKVRVYETFPIRRWDKWLDDQQTRLFVVSLGESGAAKDLLAGTRLPSARGFRGRLGEGAGDTLDPAWAPDGESIMFVATTEGDTASYDEPVTHLYQVPTAGGEPKQLTSGVVSHALPEFSPDGTTLCFQVSDTKGKIYAHDRIACARWPWSRAGEIVTKSFDRSVAGFAFAPDGKSVYLNAEDDGRMRVWSVPVAGGAARPVLEAPRGAYQSLKVPPKASPAVLVATWESAVNPAEVVRIDLATGKQTFLTSFNVEKAAAIDWQPLREFSFISKGGRRLHSFLALPPGFDESRKYPLLVLIHGGHQSMWRDAITRRWNYHLLASPGYVVLLTDYRGSTGYGEKFTLDILGDPLRGPAEDLIEAADEAVRRFPFLDGARQAAAGASYGGHLANWLEATTTRFRCLISHAGLASLYAQWATSDFIYHRELMMGAPFWERPQAWLDQSPTTYAASFKTPMLLSIGESDYRVPLNGSLEMWAALQRMRVPSRLLVWPEANHWITRGEDSRVFYQELQAWLKKWLE